MANTVQAKKRARQGLTRRAHNTSLRSQFRTYLKKVISAVASGDKALAQDAYKEAVPVIDSMVNKRIIHRNKADRHKSRLNAHIRDMQS